MARFPADAVMQAVAAENNLAETAFLVRDGGDYRLRVRKEFYHDSTLPVTIPTGNERVTLQVLPMQPAPPRERMLRRAPEDPRARKDRYARNVLAARPVGTDCEVRIPARDRRHEALDGGVANARNDIRMVGEACLDRQRQHGAREHERSRNPHEAGRAIANVRRGALGEPQVLQDGFGRGQEFLAGRGQCHTPGAALEEPEPRRYLEILDELADGRRREVEPSAGGREAQRLGDLAEGIELPERVTRERQGVVHYY